MTEPNRRILRKRRHRRSRRRVVGTAGRPRLNVFRSLSHIYAQIIDDGRGHTLMAASTLEPKVRSRIAGMSKTAQAGVVGQMLAERARAAGITRVVFDRGGHRYHGRIRALARGAREGGLDF